MGQRPIVVRFISKPCRQSGHVLTRWQCYSNMQLTQRATHTPTTGNGSRSQQYTVRSSSDGGTKILGIWKLVSFEAGIEATSQKEPVMGQKPTGYAVFTPEGRAFFMLTTREGRKPAKTAERADLLDTLDA